MIDDQDEATSQEQGFNKTHDVLELTKKEGREEAFDKVKSEVKSKAKNLARGWLEKAATRLAAVNPIAWWVVGISLVVIVVVVFLAVVWGYSPAASVKEPRSAFESVTKSTTAKADLATILKASPDQISLPDSDKAKLEACQSTPEKCQIDARVIGLISLLSSRFNDHIRVSIMDSYDPDTNDDVLSREQDPLKQPVLSAHALGQAVDVYELGYTHRNGWMENIPVELGWARSNNLIMGNGKYSIGSNIAGGLRGHLNPKTATYAPQNQLTPGGTDISTLVSTFAAAKEAIQKMPDIPEVLSNEDFADVGDNFSGFLAAIRQFRANAEAAVGPDPKRDYCWGDKSSECLTVNWLRPWEDQSDQARWAIFWAWMDADFSRFDLDLKESRQSNAARQVIYNPKNPRESELMYYEDLFKRMLIITAGGSSASLTSLDPKIKDALTALYGPEGSIISDIFGLGKKKTGDVINDQLYIIVADESKIDQIISDNSLRATGRLKNLTYLANLRDLGQNLDNFDVQKFYDIISNLGYLADLQNLKEIRPNNSLVLADEYYPLGYLKYLGELKNLAKLPWDKLASLPPDPDLPDGAESDGDPSGPATQAREALAQLSNLKYLNNLKDLSDPFPGNSALWESLADLGNLGSLGDLSYLLQNDPLSFNTGNLQLLSLLGGRQDFDFEKPLLEQVGSGKGIGLYALGLLSDPVTAGIEPSFSLVSLGELAVTNLPPSDFQAIADLGKTTLTTASPATDFGKENKAIISWGQKYIETNQNKWLHDVAPSVFYRTEAEGRAAEAINFVLSLDETTLRPRQILGWQRAGTNDPAFPVSGSVLSLTVFDHLHFGY